MPSLPDDSKIVARMCAQLDHAADTFGCKREVGGTETWGWGGRSLSAPVMFEGRQYWLRVAEMPRGKGPSSAWDGPEAAALHIPRKVPRPRFAGARRWDLAEFSYYADLHAHLRGRPLSKTALPPEGLRPTADWWDRLSDALTAISRVSTSRVTVRAERLTWAMPRFLGDDAPAEPPNWTTAHGDIQWSNLSGPTLEIIDWERWGQAPEGYDAAVLYVSSLAAPDVARQVRDRFGELLSSPSGRFAQLYAASEFIQGFERGNNLLLEPPIRNLVARLL
ncbi:hypothetical protein OHB13_12060 [Streptomyces sp. NBC_00440]|uniref:hypothetical protein n=1 Tax=Streptomyces sp. NBC_00440 TaxID=2975741 RepID=UPI002E1AA3FE